VFLEIFATNAPDPHHWNLNSCFGAFLSIWEHLEPFRYCTKHAPKRAKLVQLMQKFVPWCLVRIYATNDLDPYHWTLNSCFGAFLSVWGHLEPFCYRMKLAAKRAKLVQVMQKFLPRCLVRSFCNERSRSTPLDPKLMFGCVSLHSGAFGTVSLLHETRCKWANLVQLMQEFVPQSPVRISRNRRSRSTQLDPKLMFSCVSFR